MSNRKQVERIKERYPIGTRIELLSTMADEDSELICLYYGADVTKDDADTLSDAIEDKFPECEVEVNFGGQPIYYYMISVE